MITPKNDNVALQQGQAQKKKVIISKYLNFNVYLTYKMKCEQSTITHNFNVYLKYVYIMRTTDDNAK